MKSNDREQRSIQTDPSPSHFAQSYNLMLLSIFVLVCFRLSLAQGCLNNEGRSVDWWVILKTPKSVKSASYLYFDSPMTTSKFVFYKGMVDSPESSLGRTLNQINALSMSTIAWNDQKPNGTTSSAFAHSKGLIAEDSKSMQGFIIQHSIPRYPAFRDNRVSISINESQNIYGQHLFCISLPSVYLELLAEKLLVTKLYIYQSHCNIDPQFKHLNLLCNSKFTFSPLKFSMLEFDVQNSHFKHIFKNAGVQSSIFEDGIAVNFNQSIIAQTWGRPHTPNSCKDPNIINAKTLSFENDVSWTTTADHSKWLISITGSLCCFGGMNRMESQTKRGGYYLCIENARYLHEALLNAVTYDACPANPQL